MNFHPDIISQSNFMIVNVPRLLQRFTLSYFKEDYCVEYLVKKRFSTETLSSSLVFSYSPLAKDLHVSKFYPELKSETDSKYLSAACFFLLIHHFAESLSLDGSCHISLETAPEICQRFYTRLKDFNFHVVKYGLGNVVEVVSDFYRSAVDTSMIEERVLKEGEIPFLK